MVIFLQKKILKSKILIRLTILFTILTGILFSTIIFNIGSHLYIQKYTEDEFQNLNLSNGNTNLFEGNENPLNITDYGNLYSLNQEIQLSDEEDYNLSYYLDEVHDWSVSKIEHTVYNIRDTRNWINNSEFESPTIYRNYQVFESPHNYDNHHDPNWNSPDSEIYHGGALYIRAHFVNFSFEQGWDYLLVANGDDEVIMVNDSIAYDVLTPWTPGNTLKIDYDSDNTNEVYGYYIDYYEFINDTSNIGFEKWGFDYKKNYDLGINNYGPGEIGNESAMFVAMYPDFDYATSYDDFWYETGAFSEIYQNITVPRKAVIDASIAFDYYCQFGLETNDNIIYIAMNDQKLFSIGMADVISLGKNEWHHSGKIPLDIWLNTSNIFDTNLPQQVLNLSLGIKIATGWGYGTVEDVLQNVIWFDNVQLEMTTIANATQSDIDLRINNECVIDKEEWGSGELTFTNNWTSNPIIQTINTSSPKIEFVLNTTLHGLKIGTSKYNQQNDEGITYNILDNYTIVWEFYHNFYMPSQYSDFEFIIDKPHNWEFISVLDPTLQSKEFEGGNIGDDQLKINKSNALFPGWWSFKAISPNFLNISNTKMLKQGQWVDTSFSTGETTRIKTQVNYSDEIPLDVVSTDVNLTIYFPNGSIWYQETMNPYTNGTVIFSEITFTALNNVGGQYNYTIFWTNGTALGGVKSSFVVNHYSSITLLKPDDAIGDLRTAGFVGDIIPVRILVQDSENNFSISNSIISYNWTDGTRYFSEAALGIYETILDTADLASRGLYNILIESSMIGFFEANLTLEINLGEETNLQILDSDYNIELHANSTIKFNFTDYDGDGIDGATVNVGISNTSLYTINNTGNGGYNIEFSTLYIDTIGIHQLDFSFEASNYEPQYYTYQFQITEQSVDIIFYFNNSLISENSLQQVTFYDEINISAQVLSNIDIEYVSGGTVSWKSENLEKDLIEYGTYWYNTSIIFNPTNFTFGINYVYLEFQHDNYKTHTFGFQLLVNQIEFGVDLVGFEDTIHIAKGGTLSFEIQLLDPETSNFIENASVLYNWQYGVGSLNEISPGVYKLILKLPENLQGNFNFKIIVSKEGTVYKATEFSFLLTIGETGIPAFIIWLILIAATAIISVLGILSLRSYVFIPRKRKKVSKLLSRTQRYKDLKNIQAIVVIHKLSGIPLYSKSYSILEKQKKELFSGFIQAITTIGEEIAGKGQINEDSEEITVVEKILELDFKYFDCLICDQGDIRIVLVLKEKASDRLKEIIVNFSMGLTLELSREIENWDGSLDMFEALIPPILENYIELFYKEPFELNSPEYIAQMRKEMELTSMETRVLNVIYSMVKTKNSFYLDYLLEAIHEQNKDKVIDSLENLIERKLIISAKK
ncbi:MAG: hypothetical protein ACFFD5_04090 [Candidatus Thorarchaeota archaeon]